MVNQYLRLLVAELIDGTIDDSSLMELQQQVKADLQARGYYLDQIEMHGLLTESFSRGKSEIPTGIVPNTEPILPAFMHGPSTWFSVLLLAVIAGAGWAFWPADSLETVASHVPDNVSIESQASLSESEVLPSSVARVTNGKEMQWKDVRLRIGNWLSAEQYELVSGAAEVTFDSGTVMSVIAPARFELVSSNHTILHRGSITANVPSQAVGFRVATPSGEIVDLSTQFSLTVAEDGHSNVSVIDGLVEAVAVNSVSESAEYNIPVGEKTSFKLVSNRLPQKIPFRQPETVEFSKLNNSGYLNFVHYSFDETTVSDGVVINNGTKGQPNGKINLPKGTDSFSSAVVQSSGTFGKALYFAGSGGSIESQITGISGNKPRTVAFWVRLLPGTHKRHAYAFAGWGKPGDKSGQKWQVSWNANRLNGQPGAVRTEFGGGHVIGSTDLRDGKWHHVASVYIGDQSAGLLDNVKHYVDGKLEYCSHVDEIEIDTSTKYRSLVLGDKVEHATDYFKGYKGWLDEFYVFDAALTPSQIVTLMEKNTPPDSTTIIDSFFGHAGP